MLDPTQSKTTGALIETVSYTPFLESIEGHEVGSFSSLGREGFGGLECALYLDRDLVPGEPVIMVSCEGTVLGVVVGDPAKLYSTADILVLGTIEMIEKGWELTNNAPLSRLIGEVERTPLTMLFANSEPVVCANPNQAKLYDATGNQESLPDSSPSEGESNDSVFHGVVLPAAARKAA